MVIGLLTKNNVIKKHGDLVEESELTRPSADLLAENFIVEASKSEIKSALADDKDDEIEKQKQAQIAADLKAEEEKQKQADADQKKTDSPLDKLKK